MIQRPPAESVQGEAVGQEKLEIQSTSQRYS